MSNPLAPNFNPLDDTFKPVDKVTGGFEFAKTNAQLALFDSETLSAGRFIQRNLLANDDDLVEPDQITELFPDIDTTFDEPKSAAFLGALEGHVQERKRLEEIISRRPESFSNTVLGFGSALIGAAADPIGLATGKLLGVFGVGEAIISKVASKSLLGRPIAKHFVKGGIEGALGNVVSEIAFTIPSQQDEIKDLQITERILFAAAAGSILPTAISGLNIGKLKLQGLSNTQIAKLYDYTGARIEADKSPNISDEEIEIITGKSGVELKTEFEDVELRINELQETRDVERISNEMPALNEELALKGDEIKVYEERLNAQQEIKERVNSKENDIYSRPDSREKLDQVDEDIPPIEQQNQNQIDNVLNDTEIDDTFKQEVQDTSAKYEQFKGQAADIAQAAVDCFD